MARYRSHQAAEIPGGFGIRIVMLLAALFSIIFLKAQCASGVANVFDQIAPPQSTSAPTSVSAPALKPVVRHTGSPNR